MGASQKINPNIIDDRDVLQQLMYGDGINIPNSKLRTLLSLVTSQIKFDKQFKQPFLSNDIYLTQSIIHLFIHNNLNTKCMQYYRYLVQYLHKMLEKKSVLLMLQKEWRLCYALSQFVMLIYDQNIRQYIGQTYGKNMDIRTQIICKQQLHQQHLHAEEQRDDINDNYNTTNAHLQCNAHINDSLLDNMKMQQKLQSCRIIRQFMYHSLNMKNKVVSNLTSKSTLQYATVQNLFTLYSKISNQCINDRLYFVKHIKIGAYVLGYGIQYSHPATINLAVNMLDKIIKCPDLSQQNLKIQSIDAHYFKDIPYLKCSSIFQCISTYLLFIVCFRRQSTNVVKVIHLFTEMLSKFRPANPQITYYVDKLCQIQQIQHNEKQQFVDMLKKYGKIRFPITEIMRQFILNNSNKGINQSFGQRKMNNTLGVIQKSDQSVQLNSKTSQKSVEQLIKQQNTLYNAMVVARFMPNADKSTQIIIKSANIVKFRQQEQIWFDQNIKNESKLQEPVFRPVSRRTDFTIQQYDDNN